jgi:hypothetical protein
VAATYTNQALLFEFRRQCLGVFLLEPAIRTAPKHMIVL